MKLTLKIVALDSHAHMSLFVNGALASTPAGLCVRAEELDAFIERLKPDKVERPGDDEASFCSTCRRFYDNRDRCSCPPDPSDLFKAERDKDL